MKKIKFLMAFLFAGVLALSLASCFGISQSYADKINDAAAEKEYITKEEAKEKLGDNAVDIKLLGVLIAVKGCDSIEDIKEKLDDGKDVKGIIINYLGDNCLHAEYKVITADDLK